MNRLRLDGEEQTINLSFGNTEVIGTSAKENIVLDMGLDNISLGVSEDDTITFGKEISKYEITAPGGNEVEVVDDEGNKVTISVNGVGEIGFMDGKAPLDMDSDSMKPKIGDTELDSDPMDTNSISLEDLEQEIIDGSSATPDFKNKMVGGDASSNFN